MISWPEIPYIFKGTLRECIIRENLIQLYWGAAFNSHHVKESLIKDIEIDEKYTNIMVIHGDISNTEQGNEYNPITLKDIRDSNLDYIAIGHRHNFSGILREGNTFYSYAGCPQGRGFDELDDKGIVIGEV